MAIVHLLLKYFLLFENKYSTFLFFNKLWINIDLISFFHIKYAVISQVTVENKVIIKGKNNSDILLVNAQANNIKNMAQVGIHNWARKGITNKNRYIFDSKNVRIILILII